MRLADDGPACVVCGCTHDNACDGGCSWAAAPVPLCSQCEIAYKLALQLAKRLHRNPAWNVFRKTVEIARVARRVQDDTVTSMGGY